MSGSEYLLWSYGQFEKMTFFPLDPLGGGVYGVCFGDEKGFHVGFNIKLP